MQVTLNVRRYDPEGEDGARWQSYDLDFPEHFTVLDCLIHIREFVDGTLGLRTSCRSAICGSCAMRINGHAALACKIKLAEALKDGAVTVEPMGNLPVVKDLVVDMVPLWDKIRAVQPWLQPEGPPPEREHQVPDAAMTHLSEVMNCIMCGACVSDCTVLEAELKQGKPYEETFLAPAALAKAYRFVADPRDAQQAERLRALSESHGNWDCTHCFECVQVCPKGVAPMDRILKMREMAVDQGIRTGNGPRHHDAFAFSIEKSGRLYETTFAVKSVGFLNLPEVIPMMPTGLRMARAGKAPIRHHGIPNVKPVKRIFQKTRKARKAAS